ncbi:hypothetical protein [Methylomonas sp. UP202]|uniref:hypothetical protein n=1 Tax=Methylomonas sp. UP202 TaxID=3040943 RepID=UPI002478FDD5|nr:hypothetical protein [Methylomonas sp. UP202]WGS85961.1 hypothetical protein QC632_23455 [Methylomonas sp. UP202]
MRAFRFPLAIALFFCFLYAANANVYLNEINEIDNDEIGIVINTKYYPKDKLVVYSFEVSNKGKNPIFVPPKYDTTTPRHKGFDPFCDIELKINDQWIRWVDNRRVPGWEKQNGGMTYSPFYAGTLRVNSQPIPLETNDREMKFRSVPTLPQAIRVSFPYKTKLHDKDEKIATFVLEQKSLEEYRKLLSE